MKENAIIYYEEDGKYIPCDNIYVFTPEELAEHDLIVIQLHEERKKAQIKPNTTIE